jgi:hypothetical protein
LHNRTCDHKWRRDDRCRRPEDGADRARPVTTAKAVTIAVTVSIAAVALSHRSIEGSNRRKQSAGQENHANPMFHESSFESGLPQSMKHSPQFNETQPYRFVFLPNDSSRLWNASAR